MKKSFVSIVVPMYNSERTIEQCIVSLINQNYPKKRYEIIIVDDHSTDNSAKIVSKFKNVQLIRQAKGKKGPAAARNLGIKHAKGEFIASTDSDCVVPKDWLGKFVFHLANHPEIDALGGSLIACASNNFICKCEGMLSDCAGHKALIATPNAIFRKKAIIDAGLFKENFTSGEDPDLIWRMEEKGCKISFLSELPVVHHYYRASFKHFFKHHIWYGRGRVLLADAHPGKFSIFEKNFHLISLVFLAVFLPVILFFRNLFAGFLILSIIALFLFTFGRRIRLINKISGKYGPINSSKCASLFPLIDIANFIGMTKQKFLGVSA